MKKKLLHRSKQPQIMTMKKKKTKERTL